MRETINVALADLLVSKRARKDIGDISDLKSSIERQGLLQPIIIDEDRKVLAGGRRYEACRQLGLREVECKIIPKLSPAQKLLIELEENSTRKDFTWLEDIRLKARIHLKLEEAKRDWSIRKSAEHMGISKSSLSADIVLLEAIKVFPELGKKESKAQAKAAYKKIQMSAEAAAALSELSSDERKRIEKMLNGKSTLALPKKEIPTSINDDQDLTALIDECSQKETPVEKELPAYTYEVLDNKEMTQKIPDNTIGFIELDPPYAIDFEDNYGKVSNIKSTEEDWTTPMLFEWLESQLPILYNKMIEGSWVLCWTGKEHWTACNDFAKKAGFQTQSPGIWAKPSGSCNSPKTNMISNYEMFLLFRKGPASFNTPSMYSVLNFNASAGAMRTHQWEKPFDLYEYFFTVLGRPGSIFYSPFAGSGNSMIVAAKNKMTPIGCDLKKKHCIHFVRKFKSFFI